MSVAHQLSECLHELGLLGLLTLVKQPLSDVREAVGWDELESSLARLRDGEDLYYSGLTGPLLMDSCGARKLGATSEWTVQSGAIVDRE